MSMKTKVYIDGQSGTTGLQIFDRIGARTDLELLRIAEDKRHDIDERKKFLNEADIVFLCLPDQAAIESVSLIENENVDPTQLLVYTGPAIEQRNFEAMDDIINLVKAMSFDTSSFYKVKDETHYLLNSKGLIKQQLLNLGVKEEHIEQSPICTYEDERFFSYRKTKTKDRNMSIIYMLD